MYNSSQVCAYPTFDVERNKEVEKQFEKRFKIRKHGCRYLSLITDLMTENQNYHKRSIEKEFELLLELHTGMGSMNSPPFEQFPF